MIRICRLLSKRAAMLGPAESARIQSLSLFELEKAPGNTPHTEAGTPKSDTVPPAVDKRLIHEGPSYPL